MAFKGETHYRWKVPYTVEERRQIVKKDAAGKYVLKMNTLTQHAIQQLRSQQREILNI